MDNEQPTAPLPGYAWFDGVLDGRIQNVGELRSAARKWERLGLSQPMLSIEGGRFTFLPSDTSLDAAIIGEATQSEILSLLEDMVALGADPSSVESTLRCTLVQGQTTTEFLFGCVGGELRNVSRSRALSHEDREHSPRRESLPDSVRELGLRRALLIMVLALVGFGLASWQSGWVDRVFATESEALVIDEGPFEGLVAIEVERKWGNYVIAVRRGDAYPTTPTETQALREFAMDNSRDVAITTVSSGQELYIQLLDQEGEVLQVTGLGLRSLITDDDVELEAKLPGRISAHTIRLALSSGKFE